MLQRSFSNWDVGLTWIEGRGFTLSEIKLAGIRKKEAKGLGIVVDHRRRSKSEEGQSLNVERLKDYKSRLVVFPRKAGKPKKGDSQVGLVLIRPHLMAHSPSSYYTISPWSGVPLFISCSTLLERR